MDKLMIYQEWEDKQQELGHTFGLFFHQFVTGEGWKPCNYCTFPRKTWRK